MNKKDWKKLVSFIKDPLQLVTKEELFEARYKHPLDRFQRGVVSRVILVPYAFKCSWCADIGVTRKGLYHIVTETLGGNIFNKRTTMVDINGGPKKDIVPIKQVKFTPEFSSSVNQIKKEGYLCDHCFECYQDKK